MNFKYFIQELIKTLSNRGSFFSRKRIESLVLFTSAMVMVHYWFWTHVEAMSVTEALAVVGSLLAYTGYTMQVIEKAKAKGGGEDHPQP